MLLPMAFIGTLHNSEFALLVVNPIPTGCCHVTLIYGLIPPMAGRNRVKVIDSWAHTQFDPKSLWPQAYFSLETFQPEEYFGPNNTLARCLLWPKTTLAQYTLARGSNFHITICHCCCMLLYSRLENVP